MLGGSEMVVGTSIASYDLMHASWCCDDPPPRPRPLRTITPLRDSPRNLSSNAELRLPQERVKYAMLGSSEVAVGTSIASYDLMHASWCCGGPLPRPRAPSEPSHHSMTPHATSQVIMSLDCLKSVSNTRCLGALKWWLEQASPPTTC